MTCIIGGKYDDGVVLISDSKITYEDHPPDYTEKLGRYFHSIITGGAGPTNLYDTFRTTSDAIGLNAEQFATVRLLVVLIQLHTLACRSILYRSYFLNFKLYYTGDVFESIKLANRYWSKIFTIGINNSYTS
jgi:hypothetical protein